MPRRSTTWARTNKNTETPSARRQRREARANGRGENQAFTSGARSTDYNTDNADAMRNAWNEGLRVQTYTSSRNGRLSPGGSKAGGYTWTFSDKDNNRQSGRSRMATRRQRYYDVRLGLGLNGG